MIQIRISWAEVPLGEILTYLDERVELDDLTEYITITVKRRHRGLEEREKLFGHQIQTKKQFKLIPGAFIISRVQCWHQAYAIVEDKVPPNMIASTNYDQFAISPNVDRRFFWWLSHSPAFTETVRSSASGVVIEKMVFKRDVWIKRTISLPPIEEQRRIVARIEELAAKVEEARSLRRQAAEEAEAIIKVAAREVFSNLSWNYITIEDLVGRENLKNGKSLKVTDQSSGVSCIRLSALRQGRINCADAKPVPMTKEEAEPYFVHTSDVFIVRGNGSKELVGQAGMIEQEVTGTIFPDLFIRVPLDAKKVLPAFFVAWWNSPQMRDKIETVAKTTSGIWKINQGHIASLDLLHNYEANAS